MQLKWSHTVLNAIDNDKLIDFYTGAMGFTIVDRGSLGPGSPQEIVFMSQQEDEHHQLAIVNGREQGQAGASLNHMAFRVDSFEEVKELHATLAEKGIDTLPLSHGNTLSLYFGDPEGNGIEVFWDTPWHVDQPQGKVWDPALSIEAALAWVEENFKDEPSFVLRDDADGTYVNRP